MSGEISIPDEFFDESLRKKKFISIERIFSCVTILELIETLEMRYEINPEDDSYYDLNIRMMSEYEDLNSSGYKTKVIQQKTVEELIDYLNVWVEELQESYNDQREEKEIIKDVFLKKRNPWYGKGEEYEMFRMVDNKLFRIKFEKTYNKCLIKAVMKNIKTTKTPRDVQNFNDYYEGLDYPQLKEAIEKRHNIKIHVTSSLKKLDSLIKNKKNNDVILFSFNQHLGTVIEEYPTLEEFVDYPKIPLNFAKKTDIIIGAYDAEWEWDVTYEDGKRILKNKEPNLICLVYKNDKEVRKTFKNFNLFVRYVNQIVSSIGKDIYLYSHNGKKVEHQFLIQEKIKWYTRQGKVPDIKLQNIAGNSIKSFNWKFGERKALFFDTTLYMKMPLDSIAKNFDTITTKGHADLIEGMDKDLFYIEKKWDWKNAKDVEYCMNDALILFEFVDKFNIMINNIFKFDENTWTLSKSSVSAIDKNFIFNRYPEIQNTIAQASLFSESYIGGRNEIFFRGEVVVPEGYEIRSKDINSSYPYEMLQGVCGRFTGMLSEYPKTPIVGKRWMMLCLMKYKNKYDIPPLGIKHQSKLIFPNFIINPTLRFLFDFEFYKLKENLDIVKVFGIYEFDEIKFDFVQELFDIKSKIDKKDPMYAAIKVLINGCYGSLAMNLLRPFKEVKANCDLDVLFEEYFINPIDEKYSWMMAKNMIKTNVCYQAAACITAQARMHLWEKIVELKNNKTVKQVLYCDTDSVYFVCDKKMPITNDTFIGGWDEEIHKNMTVLTCKGHICDDVLTLKGKTKDGEVELNHNDILKNGLLYSNNSEWIIDSSTGVITVKSRDKFSKLEYNKGIVQSDGIVTPFDF